MKTVWLAVVAGMIATAGPGDATSDSGGAPAGVEMLLPRGGIPAIFEPVFVSGAQAEVPDSAWVLGVFLNGVAKAYDLNLLNHHEVVNDQFGGLPAAPVW